MPRYNKDNVKGLKELLYNSYVHDAELENAEFDFKEDSIKITLFNPIFGAKINFTFLNIETALTIKGDWQGGARNDRFTDCGRRFFIFAEISPESRRIHGLAVPVVSDVFRKRTAYCIKRSNC